MENLAAKEREEELANNALDAIHGLPNAISLLLIQVAHNHRLDVTKAEANEAMASIRDVLSDLFFNDTHRLMAIGGYRTRAERSIPVKGGANA